MSTITETVAALTEARKVRDDAREALRVDYKATNGDIYAAKDKAAQAAAVYEKAHNLARKAIDREFAEHVAEITGLDVEDVECDNPYSDSPW